MSHRIGVDFTGLCVFSRKDVPKQLNVLFAAGHEKHRPILSFNVRHHVLFTGEPMSQVIQLPDGRQIASWDLTGKIVRLIPGRGAQPKGVRLCGGGAPSWPMPTDPLSEMDLCWVPSLGRISGNPEVNPVYLTSNPVLRSGASALSARVDIDRGFLFSHAAVNRMQPVQPWTIPTATGKPLQQYLADTVRLEIEVDSDARLRIEATRFGSREKETLTLEPVDGKIDVSITHFPEALPPRADQLKTMPHFMAYYDLFKAIPRKKPTPFLPGSTGRRKPGTHRGAPPLSGRSHLRDMGVNHATMQGIFPVKCTPGMLP